MRTQSLYRPLAKQLIVFLIIFFSFIITAYAQDLRGKVVGVADGDTITILDQNKSQHKIRLYGIDCPEGGQAYGDKAKKAISKLVYGKTVEVNVLDTDRYGREVGLVFLNNTDINAELIKQGYAWLFTKYCKVKVCANYEVLQAGASRDKLGLWADPKAIPPWEYRANKRSGNETSTSVSTDKSLSSKPTPAYGSYHGNVNSKVFHAPGCQHYNCKNCVRRFNSINEAESAGYRPHKACVK